MMLVPYAVPLNYYAMKCRFQSIDRISANAEQMDDMQNQGDYNLREEDTFIVYIFARVHHHYAGQIKEMCLCFENSLFRHCQERA